MPWITACARGLPVALPMAREIQELLCSQKCWVFQEAFTFPFCLVAPCQRGCVCASFIERLIAVELGVCHGGRILGIKPDSGTVRSRSGGTDNLAAALMLEENHGPVDSLIILPSPSKRQGEFPFERLSLKKARKRVVSTLYSLNDYLGLTGSRAERDS